jgi:hypothetical protein
MHAIGATFDMNKNTYYATEHKESYITYKRCDTYIAIQYITT